VTVVVGAFGLDLIAEATLFARGTSTPATISWRLGGVGYRVYRNIEGPKRFITTLGDDVAGRFLSEQVGEESVEIVSVAGAKSGTYVALMEGGRLFAAAAEMSLVRELLTTDLVLEKLRPLGRSDTIVLEANLAPRLVADLCVLLGERTRLVFEATSRPKIREHHENLRRLWLLSATLDEVCELAGRPEAEAFVSIEEPLTEWCEERAVEHVLVSDGPRGAWILAAGKTYHCPPPRVLEGRDTTGAGDRLLACLINGLLRGLPVFDALCEAVSLTVQAIEEGTL
jgi:sugar/nucleoside kinase (ribokinase family)